MMLFVIIGGIVSLLAAAIGVLLALRIQLRLLDETAIERKAWENAQEWHHYEWETLERKKASLFEKKISGQVQQLKEEWRQWESRFNSYSTKFSLEYTLSTLPRVEERPLSLDGRHHVAYSPPDWQPPTFYEADLRERDFSHRYLGEADFRKAQLSGAIFYMADLRGACFAGANLAGASLVGANLTDADLRGANLSGANLLVADLHDAILYDACLLSARNLTTRQVYAAIYDHTTLLDPEIDITMTRVPSTPAQNTDPSIAPEPVQQGEEPPLSPPQAPPDDPQDQVATGHATDKPENARTGTAIARLGKNRRSRSRGQMTG